MTELELLRRNQQAERIEWAIAGMGYGATAMAAILWAGGAL